MRYRKFKLLNSLNQEWELTDKNFKVFAHNPEGLGFSKTFSLIRLGDENLIPYYMINLDIINFELLFYDESRSDKYQKYEDFMSFISRKPLKLLYQRPNSFTWYRRSIEIVSLGKTQVEFEDSMLHCPLQMQTLSFWEDNEENVIYIDNMEQEETGGKIYPITYPITYGTNSVSNINLISLGMLDSPLEMTITGIVENPQYILYDDNDEIYGRGRFNGTFDKVYVNSKESEEQIELQYNNLILQNPMSYQDLTVGSPNQTYITFLKLKTGRSKLRFVLGDDFRGSVQIKWRNRYVSV